MNELCKYILDGDFPEAYNLVKNYSEDDFINGVMYLYERDDDRNIVWLLYNFMLHYISRKDIAWKHAYLADFITNNPATFSVTDAAYVIGLDHMIYAAKLDSNNIFYLKQVLSYSHTPGNYLTVADRQKINVKIKELKNKNI